MRTLSLRQLRAAVAVSRHGQISLAAREIGLTAPAVSLQIQQAEAAAETRLFDRGSDGFRPTDAGRALIAAARDIENRLAALADDLAAIRGARRGTLRLGAVSTAKYFTPRLIAGFGEEHPGIIVKLTIGNRAAIIAALEQQDIDVALMGRPPRHIAVETYLIGDHPLVIIAAPDHPLARTRHIARRRIAEEAFLVREPGSGTRMSLEMFFGNTPARLDGLGVEFNSNETIKQAVMARLGVAFISAHTIAMEVELGRLAVLDVVGTPVMRQWFAVSPTSRPASPALLAFRNFLQRNSQQFLPSVPGA